MKENILQKKSYEFAVLIVEAYKNGVRVHKEYVLFKQLLRSGTSISANLEEALVEYSRRDFAAKLSISFKEAKETEFWLNLLKDTGYLSEATSSDLLNRCQEIQRILGKTLITIKAERQK